MRKIQLWARNGFEFEKEVLLTSGEGGEKFPDTSFTDAILSAFGTKFVGGFYPDTEVACALHSAVEQHLPHLGVGRKHLILIPTVRTAADKQHSVDALFRLLTPGGAQYISTVDLFFTRSGQMCKFRQAMREWLGEELIPYGHIQNGLFIWKKLYALIQEELRETPERDRDLFLRQSFWPRFRKQLEKEDPQFRRPYNWFILTFQGAQSYDELDNLGELIARSFELQIEEAANK